MVTRALLVVALAVAPIAWAAPIFDLGSLFCGSLWDYCDYEEPAKPKPTTPASPASTGGGISINNSVVVNVNGSGGATNASNPVAESQSSDAAPSSQSAMATAEMSTMASEMASTMESTMESTTAAG